MNTNAEKSTIIRSLAWQRQRSGYYRIEGPVVLGLLLSPNYGAVCWWWYGKRFTRKISREKSEKGRYWFLCPYCCRRVLNLYVNPSWGLMGCRRCLAVVYPSQKVSWRKREPKRLKAWLGWFQRQVESSKNGKEGFKRSCSRPDPRS